MYALTHSDESVTSNQLASAIWFLLKHVPHRKREKRVAVRDAHTQSEQIFPPEDNFLPYTDNNISPLDWYTTNYKWQVNTMTVENNPKVNELKNGHEQVVPDEISQSPREHADESGSRTSRHFLLCVNCCKKKKKKLLRSVTERKRKLFSKQKRRKRKRKVGEEGKRKEGVRGKEQEEEEIKEKEGREKEQEKEGAREKEQDRGKVREQPQKLRGAREEEQEARDYEQERGQIRERAHKKAEVKEPEQSKDEGRRKMQEERSKKERKRKRGKRDRDIETESIPDKDSDATPTVSQPGKSTKRTKKRRRKLWKNHEESDEFLNEKGKTKRLKPEEREHSPSENHTLDVEKARVSYAEDAMKDSAAAKQLPEFPKDIATDFTKTCCYLCAQNTLAIKAAMSGKQGIEKDIQVSVEDVGKKKVPATEKSPVPKVRTVQSSIRVKTRETSTSCPESRAAHKIGKVKSKRKKFRLAKILSKLKRRKSSARRTVACDTDEIFVKCDNSAKCRWNNECRKGSSA